MNVVTLKQDPKYTVSWAKIMAQLKFLYLSSSNPYLGLWEEGSVFTLALQLWCSLKSSNCSLTSLLLSFVDPVMERYETSQENHLETQQFLKLCHCRQNLGKQDLWSERKKQGANKLALYIWTWIGHRKQETAIKHLICRLEETDRIAPVDPTKIIFIAFCFTTSSRKASFSTKR